LPGLSVFAVTDVERRPFGATRLNGLRHVIRPDVCRPLEIP